MPKKGETNPVHLTIFEEQPTYSRESFIYLMARLIKKGEEIRAGQVSTPDPEVDPATEAAERELAEALARAKEAKRKLAEAKRAGRKAKQARS